MTDLAHWVCINCDSVDPPAFKGDERACGICADEGENGLLVELVPASQLRRAVEDVARLRGVIANAAFALEDVADPLVVARTLHAAGGQSTALSSPSSGLTKETE